MKMRMKFTFLVLLICLSPALLVSGKPLQSAFDRSELYAAMASNNMKDLDDALAALQQSNLPEKYAYEGALLMKKSGLLTRAKDKLKLFKSGREKLEAAIRANGENVEYHFLRLMIQENAPNIVRYRNNIESDSQLVAAAYKKLHPEIRKAVRDYSKTSKVLNKLILNDRSNA
jgi:hypothetical protein